MVVCLLRSAMFCTNNGTGQWTMDHTKCDTSIIYLSIPTYLIFKGRALTECSMPTKTTNTRLD